MSKFDVLVLALAAAHVSGSTAAQILQNLEDKFVGKPSPDQVAAAPEEARDAAHAALSALYAIQLEARPDIERAAGYAAFSTFGMKLLVAGGTSGKEVAVDQRTGAAALSPGAYVYQITETGLNAELTVAGTRSFVDADLNGFPTRRLIFPRENRLQYAQ